MRKNINQATPLYKIWPGKNRFCCCGNCITGPINDCCVNLYTWLSIIGISSLYFYVVCPSLWQEISPATVIPVIFLFISTLTFLFFTQFSDPGIIPRKDIIDLIGDSNLEIFKQIQSENASICPTCQIARPPRSTHCRECDNCVQVYDHHCPFVNNCIGRNNYRYFMSFLTSLSALTVSVIAGFIGFFIINANEIIIKQQKQNENKGITRFKILNILLVSLHHNKTLFWIIIIPIGLAGICIFGLCIFHICLIIKGKTTKEKLKGIKISNSTENMDKVLWFEKAHYLFDPTQLIIVQRE